MNFSFFSCGLSPINTSSSAGWSSVLLLRQLFHTQVCWWALHFRHVLHWFSCIHFPCPHTLSLGNTDVHQFASWTLHFLRHQTHFLFQFCSILGPPTVNNISQSFMYKVVGPAVQYYSLLLFIHVSLLITDCWQAGTPLMPWDSVTTSNGSTFSLGLQRFIL